MQAERRIVGVANRLDRPPEQESPCLRLGPVRHLSHSQTLDRWGRRRTLFSGRIVTRARHENERKDGNGRSDENGVRTSPKNDVFDEGCTQLLH